VIGRILYYSRNGLSPKVTFREALLKGLAPDGGLFFPERIPMIDSDELNSFKDLSYSELASALLRAFILNHLSLLNLSTSKESLTSIPASYSSFQDYLLCS